VKRINQSRLEWALLAVIAVVCAVLSFLQYRWTGEVSRAERSRLRSGLDEEVGRFVRAFDDDIRENCTMLLPGDEELREEGAVRAHQLRYEQWKSAHRGELLARIGIVAPEHGILKLYGFDVQGRVTPMDWPPNWEILHAQMAARITDHGPFPAAPMDSTLIEVPIFDDSRRREESSVEEAEWMIFELNEDYIRNKILPHLVSQYLNPGGEIVYDASVNWAGSRGDVIFSTRKDRSTVAPGADSTADLFSDQVASPRGHRHGRSRNERPQARWSLAVRHRAGSLDAVVSRAKMRNLATSLILIGLLGGAAGALVRYTARSRRLAEMQFRFAVGVSHDLRTPLTAIRGAAFNLADGLVKEPAAVGRYGNIILRNAEELSSMIENVLAFSSTMHSRKPGRRESFAVGDLVEHAAAAMAHEVEQAGCRMEVTVASELPALSGDPGALELAFRNLIGNAARHAAEGKWIGVAAARSGGGVEVRVCDRGPGIAESEQELIFEPFYSGEHTRTVRVRGTGLGLSLVKDTVERHQGTISVHNSPGGGAQFIVRLPVDPTVG
jgi:signal transduction histidine kinase